MNSRIATMKPSQTFAASARAAQLRTEGRDVISLTLGEPDFDTPEFVKEAAVEALRRGFTKYTPVEGIALLRRRIAEKLKRDQGVEYPEAQIVVTNGGKHAIATAFSVLLNPGDEVIIPAPYWTSYPDMVHLAGGTAVIVNTKPSEGYLLRPSQLIQSCTPKTKMVVLNTPANPTGAAYSREDLVALGDALMSLKNAHEIVVLCDEIYEYFAYDSFQHLSFVSVVPKLRENILVVNGFSKAYAMTGWRVGYIAGETRIINAIITHQGQFTSNVCSIAQYAAAAAYTDQGEFPRSMVAEFSRRLDLVCEMAQEFDGAVVLPTRPRGAFYAFLRVDNILGKVIGGVEMRTAADFSDYLLDRHGVALVAGDAFGDPGALRLSFAAKEEVLLSALERIRDAVRSL